MKNETVTLSRDALFWAIEQLAQDGNKGHGYFDILRVALAEPVPQVMAANTPVKWWNGCDSEVPKALRFLANNERPSGGEDRFNAAHLFQLAEEIERMARMPLYTQPLPTDPVPPAGGEPEVLGYSVKGNRYMIRRTKGELLEMSENYMGDVLIELVDRSHVTRLQAEVESERALRRNVAAALHARSDEVKDLQSELTKARELMEKAAYRLSDLGQSKISEPIFAALIAATDHSIKCSNCNDKKYVCLDWDGGEWIECPKCPSVAQDQSAPADKGCDGWHMNPCKQGHRDVGAAGGVAHCYTCDEKIEAATTQEAFERWNSTHPAEQPAPAAVVPDLTELRDYHAEAVKDLEHYADDSGLRESDVKHYRKRAEFHRRQVALLDGLKS